MEDRVFELLSKFYGDFTEFRKETREEIGGLKGEISGLKRDIIRLETKMDENFKALYDGYK